MVRPGAGLCFEGGCVGQLKLKVEKEDGVVPSLVGSLVPDSFVGR